MDLLNKPVPELSATSDMPADNVVEGPPLSAQSGGPLERPATPPEQIAEEAKLADDESAAVDKKAENSDSVADPAEQPEPKPASKPKKGFQERIGEVTEQRRQAEERAAAAETARVAAEKRADAIEASNKEIIARLDRIAPKVDEDPRPQRASFDDPNKYDDALAGWAQRQGEVAGRSKAETEFKTQTEAEKTRVAEDARTAENQRLMHEWSNRQAKFKETVTDYDEVALNPEVPISPTMAATLVTSDLGPEVSYYLGENIAEAKRIYALSPGRQLVELGKIEAKLSAPPRTTSAPAPIEPLNTGNNAATRKSPNEESMQEYAARRQQELVAERAQQTRKR